MNWSKVLELGAIGIGAIIDYAMASAERKAEMRAKAREDELKSYDLIDEHLLKNNALVDAEADAKFGPAGTASPAATDVVATAPHSEDESARKPQG